ncbi:hypothetical protein QL285_022985 [Trifolium repens]|nr:hypothetical protein QL285_022985 [Trifolium repens]
MVNDKCLLRGLIIGSTNNLFAIENGCFRLTSTLFVSTSRVIEFVGISAQVVVGIKMSSPKMAALISRQILQTPHSQAKISRDLSTSREVYNSSKSEFKKFCGVISFMNSLEFLLLTLCSLEETNTISMGSPGDSSRLSHCITSNSATGCHHHATSSLEFDGYWRLFAQLGLLNFEERIASIHPFAYYIHPSALSFLPN